MKGQALTFPLRALLGWSYIEVLKPKETSLIAFIGVVAALLATGGQSPWGAFLQTVIAITLGVAGANALTNYLDRDVDARMKRTLHRALPSGRLRPPERALFWGGTLVAAGLVLTWLLNPWAFVVGFLGVAASLVGRKTAVTHVLGSFAGTTPVLIGWLALAPVQPYLFALFLLILVWQPLHVWSLMLAYREEYQGAGINYFPLDFPTSKAIKVLLGLSLSVYLLSWLLYFVGGLGLTYLIAANLLGGMLILANYYWLRHPLAHNARRLFKFATFPYLGLLFLVLVIEIWV